ncbi:N-acetylmuramoyl-L-alanine amidase [Catalinimonas alkaloidigena]|nr:N-acetylmuramoyl-L-alanine amidase [Catalinimonas alkaloidigena]
MCKVIVCLSNNRSSVKNIILISCFSLLLVATTFNTAGVKQYRVKRVVIDPGHGGKDPGTHGLISKEKDVVLNIAHHLGRIIKENMDDVEVIFTRKDDSFPSLEERAAIANKNDADIFISIHANALPPGHENIHGTESYVMGAHTREGNLEVAKRENSVILMEENYEERYEGFDPLSPESHILFSLYQGAYLNNSLRLADKIERQFKERVGRRSRGVKQAGFWVLWRTSMPSVLVEVGYLTNPKEEKYLNDRLGQVYIASGIYRALRDYKEEIESL